MLVKEGWVSVQGFVGLVVGCVGVIIVVVGLFLQILLVSVMFKVM